MPAQVFVTFVVKFASGFLNTLILLTVALVKEHEFIAVMDTVNSLLGKPHEDVVNI